MFCLRSLTDAAGASPSKYGRQFVRIPVESGQAVSAGRAGARAVTAPGPRPYQHALFGNGQL